MKSSQSSRSAGLALVLAVFCPVLFAEDPAKGASAAGNKAADTTASKIEDYRSNNSEMNKAEVKDALAAIDAELNHLDNLTDSAPTAEQKADAKARYKALKERRSELKKEFTRARYEAFKADVRSEKDRMEMWTKDTFSNKPAATAAANASSSAADRTADKIAEYRTDSTDVNKAEVKASLARLDADIDLLDAKIDAVNDPVRKNELKMRFKALKERRSELGSQFRKARYDALVADVKAEWNKLTD